MTVQKPVDAPRCIAKVQAGLKKAEQRAMTQLRGDARKRALQCLTGGKGKKGFLTYPEGVNCQYQAPQGPPIRPGDRIGGPNMSVASQPRFKFRRGKNGFCIEFEDQQAANPEWDDFVLCFRHNDLRVRIPGTSINCN